MSPEVHDAVSHSTQLVVEAERLIHNLNVHLADIEQYLAERKEVL